MRLIKSLGMIVALIVASLAWSQTPSVVELPRNAPGRLPSGAGTDTVGLLRFQKLPARSKWLNNQSVLPLPRRYLGLGNGRSGS